MDEVYQSLKYYPFILLLVLLADVSLYFSVFNTVVLIIYLTPADSSSMWTWERFVMLFVLVQK